MALGMPRSPISAFGICPNPYREEVNARDRRRSRGRGRDRHSMIYFGKP